MTIILFKIVRICYSQFKRNYLTKEKLFLNILFYFRNLRLILNILKNKMLVLATAFPELRPVKNFVRSLSKKRSFSTGFDSQHVKASQILAKSPWECFYHVFSLFSGKLIWKMSLLVLGEILGVFVNTLHADDKYAVQDCHKSPLPIRMQFSEKRKTFSQSFAKFLISPSNFKHFEKKADRHSECISKITDCKKLG